MRHNVQSTHDIALRISTTSILLAMKKKSSNNNTNDNNIYIPILFKAIRFDNININLIERLWPLGIQTTLIYWNITFGCLSHIPYIFILCVWMKIVFVCFVFCFCFFRSAKEKNHTDTYTHTHSHCDIDGCVFCFSSSLFFLLLLLLSNSVNLHKISFTPRFSSFSKTNKSHSMPPTKDCLRPNFFFFVGSVLFFEENFFLSISVFFSGVFIVWL